MISDRELLELAAKAAGLLVGEFSAGPVYPGEGRRAGLELVIEMQNVPGGTQGLREFASAFDASLKQQNADYTTKRTDSLGMDVPTITPVAMGAFHRWMESRGKLGGQNKCPRCANHRDIVEAVKGMG